MSAAPDRLLRMPEVLGIIGLSRPELYRRMKRPEADNRFPRPVKIGRASAWPQSEVIAWVEARKAERNAA